MSKIKTCELTGPALNWATAMAEGFKPYHSPCRQDNGKIVVTLMFDDGSGCMSWPQGFKPSSDWTKGGPIIEREGLTLTHQEARWAAQTDDDIFSYGPTLLVAAMRCFVTSKLGDEVEIPKEITGGPHWEK